MTLDSLPDLDTSGLCLVKTLSTALTCWPYRNMALRDGARTSTRTSSVAKGVTAFFSRLAADEEVLGFDYQYAFPRDGRSRKSGGQSGFRVGGERAGVDARPAGHIYL